MMLTGLDKNNNISINNNIDNNSDNNIKNKIDNNKDYNIDNDSEKNINNENNLNNSFGDLTLSDIAIKEKNSIPISRSSNNQMNDNIDFNNFNMRNEIEKRASVGSIRMEDFNNFLIKKEKMKITKEDLNNIPLPIFSCIYCSNEKVSFNHLLNEILASKYLLLTSIYDMQDLDTILSQKFLIDKDDKNTNLENVIILNTEYLGKYYTYEESKGIIYDKGGDNAPFELFQKKFWEYIINKLNTIKLKKIRKNLYKPPSIIKRLNRYYSYNNNLNNQNSSSINNSNDGIGEINFNNNIKKTNQFNTNQTCSNLSLSNFNSVSLVNYIDNNYNKEKEKKFKLDDIIEQIEKNSNIDYYEDDLSRKIKREDIEWDSKYYNIWSPVFEPMFNQGVSTINKNINKTFFKIQTRNEEYSKNQKENTINYKKIGDIRAQSGESDKNNDNKSYLKNSNIKLKFKKKEISTDNLKGLKKHTITHLITHSCTNNNKKNILINLNNTPKEKNGNKPKIKNQNFTFSKNNFSNKNLLNTTSTILNKKKNFNMKPLNLFNSSNNLLKSKKNVMKKQIPLNISIINKSTNFNNKIKNKINYVKSCNNIIKLEDSLHKNAANKNKLLEKNNLSSSKKKLLTNKINKIKKSQVNNITNKFIRNNTFKKFENRKEISVIININEEFSEELLNKKNNIKTEINKNKNKNFKINKSSLNINKNTNKKIKNNNNHIKCISDISKLKFKNENKLENKKNAYNIKILKKRNIEITINNIERNRKFIKYK